MIKEKIILIGGGGHCKAVIDVIEKQNKYEIYGIIDKHENIGHQVLDYNIISTDDELETLFHECQNACITIGHVYTNETRKKLFSRLLEIGYKLPPIISPLAYVSKYATIDMGSVVMHHVFINAGVQIGQNCIINTKALIEHDSTIASQSHISTGAIINGDCHINEDSFIGSGSVITEGKTIKGFIKAGTVNQ
jgi:sugar O-acyltransferase (sialic acid O-acetyltransferase NeuD family)